jgi:hypothetical protein
MKRNLSASFLAIILSLSFLPRLQAQYYLTGQDRASIHWKQIKTADIQLIFPEAYEKVAQYYMNILETTNPVVRKPYLKNQQRLSIILHNESTTSNAMVSPAPFHADFFDMPSQRIYPQIWQKQLALHEYRHAVQMNKMKQGFGKLLYYLMGQQGTAGLFGTFLPFWFIEGDAVYSETLHSRSGRGRMPDFVYPLKAQLIDLDTYPYDKAQFGSYRNFVPDHYTLGYQLYLIGASKKGTAMWNDVLNRVARKTYTLVPFSQGIKKQLGKGKIGFYQSSMAALKEKWEQEFDTIKPDQSTQLIGKQKFYTSYRFLQALSSGKFIAEKTGIDDVNRFIMIDSTGEEKRLFTPGFDFESSLSANDSLICWNEKAFDPRWSNRDFSVIKIFNYKTGELRQLNKQSRTFAPALSPDGKTIATVRVSTTGNYFLDFLDSKTAKPIKTLKTDNNLFFMQPAWSENGKRLVVTVLGDKGKSFLLINFDDLSYRTLLPYTFYNLEHPSLYGNWLVYSATYEGRDNLYIFNIETQELKRLFLARYGAKDATFAPNGKFIVFSDYTANGYKPTILDFKPKESQRVNMNQLHFTYPIDKLVTANTFVLDDVKLPKKNYPVKSYSRLGHLFNPYSWGPVSIDAENYTFKPGLSLLSQNNLSTAVSTLTYTRDLNENTGKLAYQFDYYGWFPVLGFNASTGNRRIFRKDDQGQNNELRWRETELNFHMNLPLNFSKGKWLRGFRPSVSYDARFLETSPDAPYQFKENHLHAFTFQLFTYNQLKRSPRDLYPRWGQSLHLVLRNTLFSDAPSKQFGLQSWLYVPGFLPHQGFRIYLGYQQQHEGNYQFSNIIAKPRGYSQLSLTDFWMVKIDYALPLIYPDLNWQGVAFLKRLDARLFFDNMRSSQGEKITKQSTGIELYSDWHFLSLFPEISLGMRWSYAFKKKNSFEFLYSIHF